MCLKTFAEQHKDLTRETLIESLYAAENQCVAAEDCLATLYDEDDLTGEGCDVVATHMNAFWGEFDLTDYEGVQDFLDEQRMSQ